MPYAKTIPAALALAVALSALPSSAADQPVFRWRTSLAGGNPGNPSDPSGPETPPDPAAGPTTHLRLTVQSYSGSSGASVAEVAFAEGTQRLAPVSAEIVENAGTNGPAAFDGNVGTAWNSSSRAVTRFVYEIAKGQEPDHLEIVASSASAPAAFLVERSSDGRTYAPVVSYSGESGWTAGEKRRYPFAKPGTDETAGARRYWRVLVDRWNPSIYKSIHTVAFKDADGQTISGAGGPYRIEPGYAGLVSALFDGDASTVWQGDYNDTSPAGIVYDFGLPRDVASVDIGVAASFGTPQRLWIESSDDRRKWTPRGRYIGQGGWASKGETRNYPVGFAKPPEGHHQFWRLAILKSNRADGAGSLNDLDVVDASGASMIAKSVAMGSSQSSSVYGTAYITPGDYNNPWIGVAGEALPWAGYTFPTPVRPEALRVAARDANSPREVAVQWSDDETNWTTSATYRGHGSWKHESPRDFPVVDGNVQKPGEHRFWRVDLERPWTDSAAKVDVVELDWRDASGASLVGLGVPTSSSGTAAKAFDRDTNRYSGPLLSTARSAWVAYEFTRPVAPATLSVHALDKEAPRDVAVSWSDDGRTWTRSARHPNNGMWGTSVEQRTFEAVAEPRQPAPGEHAWWRVTVVEGNGASALTLDELDFVAADGVDRQVRGTPLSSVPSDETSYRGVKAAFDDASDVFQLPPLSERPMPVSVGYAFREPVSVSEVRIKSGNVPLSAPRAFTIDWSDDGEAWTVAERYDSSAGWANRETRVFPIPKPKATATESYGYAVNFRRIVPQGHSGAVSAMTVDSIKLLGADGTPLAHTGVPRVKGDEGDLTIERAFDASASTVWTAKGPEARIDVGHALPLSARDVSAVVKAGCACSVEIVLYSFPDADTRTEILRRTVSGQ